MRLRASWMWRAGVGGGNQMCPMSRVRRWDEHTICTAVAAFTASREPAGQRGESAGTP